MMQSRAVLLSASSTAADAAAAKQQAFSDSRQHVLEELHRNSRVVRDVSAVELVQRLLCELREVLRRALELLLQVFEERRLWRRGWHEVSGDVCVLERAPALEQRLGGAVQKGHVGHGSAAGALQFRYAPRTGLAMLGRKGRSEVVVRVALVEEEVSIEVSARADVRACNGTCTACCCCCHCR